MTARLPFLRSWKSLSEPLRWLQEGRFKEFLVSDEAREILPCKDFQDDSDPVTALKTSLEKKIGACERPEIAFLLGLTILECFLQSNVTGPPLGFSVFSVCFPNHIERDSFSWKRLQRVLLLDLSVDGDAVYALTPHIELFWLAQYLLKHDFPGIPDVAATWARLRASFWHQKLLTEPSQTLQDAIYEELVSLEQLLFGVSSTYDDESRAIFLIERATIRTFYGVDKNAREDLQQAAKLRNFYHVLTGRLGRRTKFQQFDISQLVVLAKSSEPVSSQTLKANAEGIDKCAADTKPQTSEGEAPKHIDLNDDTLLERISFTATSNTGGDDAEDIPRQLNDIDPANQPLLHPLDSTILLAFASSITNTSPDHGLTREETLPYAVRVLEGGSSNWQVYTQALLVRSRIESHKSRTVERGVLQLQTLVDQVIAETSEAPASAEGLEHEKHNVSTFLPKATPSESAPVIERLQYVHQLSTPPRWALEGELAARWAALGGLRTALEIYERLEMWAEASLCLAATDQEAKASQMIRKQLFEPSSISSDSANGDDYKGYNGAEKCPPDAPRLFCILGDIEEDPKHYERAWEISKQRYSRAQRSLGKYYVAKRELEKADSAYALSLRMNPQNAPTWFALGCVRLETQNWEGAVGAFKRVVSIEHEDAEAWSNLAAALMNLPPPGPNHDARHNDSTFEDDEESRPSVDPQMNAKQAFVAFKRAAALKHDSYRIWQNLLNTGARLAPPPFTDLLVAQRRLIELRGATEGEGCVDVEILDGIMRHVITQAQESKLQNPPNPSTSGTSDQEGYDFTPQRRGLEKMLVDLMQNQVIPLITHSRKLWQLVARLNLHLNKPSSALEAYEKTWRVTLNRPGWDDGSVPSTGQRVGSGDDSDPWTATQEATEELVDAYESLGEREVTEGLKAGSGELVCKNWRFKARTAVRSVVGRRTKAGFDDVDRLKSRLEGLSG